MARCRNCGSLIVWGRLRNGRPIPIDAVWRDGMPQPNYLRDGNLIPVEDVALGAGGPGLLVEVARRDGTPRWRAHFTSCEPAS